MGIPYELVSWVYGKAKRSCYTHMPASARPRVETFSYGPAHEQRAVWWEPAMVRHACPVVYFHGGGYVFGTPESIEHVALAFATQGYRFVAVGYRKVPKYKFPVMIDDAFAGTAAAIAYLRVRGIPAERVILGGTSAGGMSAALMSYGVELCEEQGFAPGQVAACVSLAGVADAKDLVGRVETSPALWRRLTALPGADGDRTARERQVERFSPLWIVQHEAAVPDVPFFAIHGNADTLSPYASQVKLVDELRLRCAKGKDAAQLYTLDGREHQHLHTTKLTFKQAVDESPALQAMFSWLEALSV